MTQRELLQQIYDDITSFMLDIVPDDTNWEDAFPELDDIRSQIGDLLAATNGAMT